MNLENLIIERVNRKRAWAYCSCRSPDIRPTLEICLQGPYRGRCYCWACGYKDFIPEDKLKEIFGEEKSIIKKVPIDWKSVLFSYHSTLQGEKGNLVENWKISQQSFIDFRAYGWNGEQYFIPMRNETFDIIGIQLRYPNGFKRCKEGSQLGLFIPSGYKQRLDETLYICEGFSDAVTVYDLGFFAIGRPNALACMETVKNFIKLNNIKKIVIVADNDESGRKGACKLWDYLQGDLIVTIKIPFQKDIREMYLEKGREFTIDFLKSS